MGRRWGKKKKKKKLLDKHNRVYVKGFYCCEKKKPFVCFEIFSSGENMFPFFFLFFFFFFANLSLRLRRINKFSTNTKAETAS